MKRCHIVIIILVVLLLFAANAFAVDKADGGSIPALVKRPFEDIAGEEQVGFEDAGGTIIGHAATTAEVSAMDKAGLLESTPSPTSVVTVLYPAVAAQDANPALTAPESPLTVAVVSVYQGERQSAEQVDRIKGPVLVSDDYRFAVKRGWRLCMDEDFPDGYTMSEIKTAVACAVGYVPIGADVVEKTVSYQIPAEQWVVGAKPGYAVTEFMVTEGGGKVLATGCVWRANGLIVQYEKHPI